MIEGLDQDVQKINDKLEGLEETIQTNFENLSNKIVDKIQETDYKQFLNEFTQTSNRNAFSYYAFFKPDLHQRYHELIVALEAGNQENIKQAYDNLYLAAKQSEQLYYYVSGESTILTGKQSIQDILYDYSILAAAENFELTCVEFAEDVNSTFILAQYYLSLCYHYQLLYAQMNGQSYDAYYYIQQGDSNLESIQYASIPSLITKMVEQQNTVTRNLAKYLSKVLRLSGEFDYTSQNIRFGTVPYAELSATNIYGGTAYRTTSGSTGYYRTNNNVQKSDLIRICEMPDDYLEMFNPAAFGICVSNGNAKVLPGGMVQVVGSSGSFDIIYQYDGMECYRATFQIASKYSGGLGIEQAPYLISTRADFEAIRTVEDTCHYLLLNDINCNGAQFALKNITTGGFGGVLDGGGHKIYNYSITAAGIQNNQFNNSLFPIIKENAVIKNLTVGDPDTTSYGGYSVMHQYNFMPSGASLTVYNGVLSGINKGIISNCVIQSMKVDAKLLMPQNASYYWALNAYIGGFAAENQGTIAHCTITDSSLFGCYRSNQSPCRLFLGGIAGINHGKVINCFSTENTLTAETTASSSVVSTQSLIYGGNIIGQNNGSAQTAFGENCSLKMTPMGSHTKQFFYGVHTTSMPSATVDGTMESYYGWKDRGDGKAVLDHEIIKTVCDLVDPHKTIYYLGEELNLTGLELYYSNSINPSELGVPNKARAYDFAVFGFDPNKIGTQTVTLAYDELSVNFEVTVQCPHQWENGSETKRPSHTDYGTYTETCKICGQTRQMATDKIEEHAFTLNASHTCDICKYSKKPDQAVVESKTSHSVTLVYTEGFEYSMDTVVWQSSNVFTELSADTAYTFYQRVRESSVAMASEPSVAIAVITDEEPTYVVTFLDEDGTVLSMNTYHFGEAIIVPADPTRVADAVYSYVFAGWDREVVNCTGDATYTATYTKVYREYTVIFADDDGTELSKATYHWGDEVIPPADPAKEPDETYTYVFEGWDKEVTICMGDVTYTATYSCHREPVAKICQNEYDTLEEAVAAAKAGDTIVLLADAEVYDLIVRPGVTLDLNGWTLVAEYAMGFAGSNVIDSAGGGLLRCGYVHLAHDNAAMPVWEEAADGYRFFVMKSQQAFKSQTENSFVFVARPLLGSAANSYLMAQSETNGLSVKVKMSWETSSGNLVEQLFSMKAEDVEFVYTNSGKVIQLTVGGAASYVGKMWATTYIESETGVIWTGEDMVYTGE